MLRKRVEEVQVCERMKPDQCQPWVDMKARSLRNSTVSEY